MNIKKDFKKLLLIIIMALLMELVVFNYQHWWSNDSDYRRVELEQCYFKDDNHSFIMDDVMGQEAVLFNITGDTDNAIMFETPELVDNLSILVRSDYPSYYLFDDYHVDSYEKNTGVVNVCIYTYDLSTGEFNCLFQEDIYAVDKALGINFPGKIKADMLYITFRGQADNNVILDSIELNQIPDLEFSFVRFGVLLIVAFVIAYAKEIYSALGALADARFVIGTTLVMAFLLSLIALSNSALRKCNVAPDSYNILAESILDGKVSVFEEYVGYLDVLDDPYDYHERIEKQVYYMLDYAYFNGNYYVYFGVVPCILFYLPYNAIFGAHINNTVVMAGLIFSLVCGMSFLLNNICDRFFGKISRRKYLFLLTLIAFGAQIPYMSFLSMVYEVAQVSAIMFVVWGLAFYVKAGGEQCTNYLKNICLGSIFMALSAGCRPHISLFAIIAIPLLWDKMMVKNVKSIKQWLYLGVPYIMVAIPLMYYNYIRFGSCFDFGSKYNLTIDTITTFSFTMEKVGIAFDYLFFRLPHMTWRFPFFEEILPTYNNIDKQIKITIGGYFATNIIMLLAFMPLAKNKCKAGVKNCLLIVQYLLLLGALAIGVIDVVMNGCLERYSIDVAIWISLATVIVLLRLLSTGVDRRIKVLLIVVLLWVVFVNVMLMFYTDPIPLDSLNIKAFQYISRLVMFWR